MIQQSRNWFKSFLSLLHFTHYKKRQSTERTSSGKTLLLFPQHDTSHYVSEFDASVEENPILRRLNWEKKQRTVGSFWTLQNSPVDHTARTWVQIQADKKVNNDPRIPSLGHHCPWKDHCSLIKIIPFRQCSAPQFECSPSTQPVSRPLPLQIPEKADTLLPPTPRHAVFLQNLC